MFAWNWQGVIFKGLGRVDGSGRKQVHEVASKPKTGTVWIQAKNAQSERHESVRMVV